MIASPDAPLRQKREYGRAGLFGILTPQGNPTAETEIRLMLPAACAMLTARMNSIDPSLKRRLVDYSERLDTYIADFAGIRFDGVGFACTGSSYLVEPAQEHRRVDAAAKIYGFPVVTATAAIGTALAYLGVGAVALVSPYPDWLTAASRAHWERSGLRITAVLQLPTGSGDAHNIYGLTTEAVMDRAAGFDPKGAEAILVTGTGMASLRTILELMPIRRVPILSSNLCLAWALARLTGSAEAGPESPLLGGWRDRLAQA